MSEKNTPFNSYGRNSRTSAYYRSQNPIEWQPGEQQALIAKTLAEGKVTKCKPGAYTQSTFSPYVSGLSISTVDSLLTERRVHGREISGRR